MATKRIAATGRMNTHVTWAESTTEPGLEYQIVRRPSRELKCACLGWAFSKARPKSCIHIEAYAGVAPSYAPRPGVVRTPAPIVRPDVTVGTVTFRGIVFEGRV